MIDLYVRNTIFSLCAVFFLSFLFVIFILKKRVGFKGNNNLLYLLIADAIIIFAELFIPYFLIYHPNDILAIKIFCYIYNFGVCSYSAYLAIVLFDSVAYSDNDFKLKFLRIKNYLIVGLLVIIFIMLFSFDIYCSLDDTNSYSFTGTLKYAAYSFNTFIYVLCVIFILSNRNKINKVVLRSLLISFVYYIGDIVISFVFNVSYHDVSLLYTIVIYTMYLTFESQDDLLLKAYKDINIESEKSINEKNDFLFNMSHKIRIPLTNIVGFSSIIKDNPNEYIKYIKISSNDLNVAINSLVDISNIKTNNISLNESNYYIKDLFNELINNMNVILDNRVTLNISYDNVCNCLYGDKEKLLRCTEYVIYSIIRSGNDVINIKISNKIEENISNLNIIISGNVSNKYNEEYVNLSKDLLNIMNGKLDVIGNDFIISLNQIIRDTSIVVDGNKEYYFDNMNVLIIGKPSSNVRVFKSILDKKNIKYDEVNEVNGYEKNINLNNYNIIFVFSDLLGVSYKDAISFLKMFGMSLPNVVLLSSYSSVISSNIELYDDYIKLPIISENNVYMVIDRANKGGEDNGI